MLATVILAVLIFGYFVYVIYSRFFKHKGGCHDCVDKGCPLNDTMQQPASVIFNNHQ